MPGFHTVSEMPQKGRERIERTDELQYKWLNVVCEGGKREKRKKMARNKKTKQKNKQS